MVADPEIRLTRHDEAPAAAAAIVDRGLGEANAMAAPLHEVRPLSCFAHGPDGTVLGGAIGRTWGPCAELQQLWVDPARRRCRLGTRLLAEFEAAAAARGVRTVFLETFSFQAPGFYRARGYEEACEHAAYPHGIVRYLMRRTFGPAS